MKLVCRTLVAFVVSALAIVPGPSYAQTRKGDVLMKLGPPQQVMQVDGEEFWIYRWVTPNQQSQIGAMLQGLGNGFEGRAYTPQVQADQHMLILRFGAEGS